MTALMAAIWPSIEDSVGKLVESYPSGLKEAFGIQELDSIEKYIDGEMLSLVVPLALAFFAVRCAIRATVGAEDRGHLDTLLSLPVSRRTLVMSSFAVTGVMLLAILGVVWALTWVTGTLVGGGISGGTLAAGLVNVWPLSMLFAGLAVLAAGFSHRPATVTAIATGTLVAMYVVDLAGKLSDQVEPLRARVGLPLLRLGDPGRAERRPRDRPDARRDRPGRDRRAAVRAPRPALRLTRGRGYGQECSGSSRT